MNKKQRELLVALKEALEAQPEMPSYSDYEEYEIMSRKEYYDQYYDFQLVEDIKELLWK